jgi:hypothetical protein
VSVLVGMTVGRCGRPTSKPSDEPPSLGDDQDGLGMTVVVVDQPERWTHCSNTTRFWVKFNAEKV